MHRLPLRFAARLAILGSVSGLLCFSVLTSSVSAETVVETLSPFPFSGTNTCTGEDFVGTGGVHLVITGNLSPSGMVQSHIQANFQGMRATALISGKKYQVPDSETHSLEFDSNDLPLAPAHETFEVMFQFIRAGEDGTLVGGDDFYTHILAHSTINANGVVTVEDLTVNVRCQ
jgi:hypothetical protein